MKESSPKDLENDLKEHIRNLNKCMYIQLLWLVDRWYPFYSKYDDHLPKQYTGQ